MADVDVAPVAEVDAPAPNDVGGGAQGGGDSESPEAQAANIGKGGAKKAPPKPRIERIRQRVNGKDEEIEVPFEELVQAHQKSRAADQRLRQAAEERKAWMAEKEQASAKAELWKSNPVKALMQENPGISKKQAIEWLAQQMNPLLEEESMDPRERAVLEEKAKREDAEAQLKQFQQQKEQQEFQQALRGEMDKLGSLFAPALEKSGLPADHIALSHMAEIYGANKELGLDLTPDEMGAAVFKAEVGRQNRLLAKLDGEQLLNSFPELTTKIHKALIARYEKKRGGGQAQQQQAQPKPNGAKPSGGPMSEKEFNKVFGLPF